MRVSSPIKYDSILRDYPHARTEAELTAPCTHFTLPGYRYAADVTQIRRDLAQLCEVHTQSERFVPVVLRPPLNAVLRTCFDPGTNRRCRLVFDLDTVNNELPRQQPQDVGTLVAEWAAQWTTLEQVPRSIAFCGDFEDKLSYHVYLPDFCWDPNEDNRYRNNQVAIDDLNVQLADYNLLCDVGITNGSIKMPFMDKQLKDDTWRGQAQEPQGELLTFKQYFSLCDPAVVQTDAAWQHTVSFKPEARTKRRALTTSTRTVAADTIEARILGEVPAWNGCTLRHAHGREGGIVIIPESRHCPLKEHETDTPAFEHSKMGRTYILVDAMGTCTVRCHICTGKQLTIAPPAVPEGDAAAILEKFNTRFAMLSGDTVLEYGLEMVDTHFRLMSQDKFCKQESLEDEEVKVRTAYKPWPKIWLTLRGARRYPYGLICDPSRTCDLRYYNTYRGMQRDVVAFADSVADEDSASLVDRYLPNWHDMVSANICGGEVENLRYLISWMSDCIKHPERKPGVALVFTGDAGAGKGLCARMMVEIFGRPHGVQIEASKITNNWNSFFADAVVVFADESEAQNDKVLQSRLKMLITEEQQVVTQRYHDEVVRHSFQHFIIVSNNSPVYWQKGERRFAVFDAKKRLEVEPEFFDKVAAEVRSVEGRGAFLAVLRQYDTSGWYAQRVPVTRATWHTQYSSFSMEEKYIYHVLLTGNLVESLRYEPPAGQVSVIHALCERNAGGKRAQLPEDMGTDIFSAERAGYWYPVALLKVGFCEMFPKLSGNAEVQLGRVLSAIFEDHDLYHRERQRVGGSRIYLVRFGDRDQLRATFCKHRGNLDNRIFGEWKIE